MLSCLTMNSFSVCMPIEHFKAKIGIEPNMYASNIAFYNRLVKPSLLSITQSTKISVQSEFEKKKENLTLYVLSEA